MGYRSSSETIGEDFHLQVCGRCKFFEDCMETSNCGLDTPEMDLSTYPACSVFELSEEIKSTKEEI